MSYYVAKGGQIVESDGDPETLAAQGLSPATDEDIDRHNSQLDYEEKGLGGKAAEAIGAGVKAMVRGAESGLGALGLDMGVQRDEHGNAFPQPGIAEQEGLYGAEARFEGERHPIAAGIGQGALAAPLGFGAGALGAGILGAGGAALGAESMGGGYLQEAEEAWLQDRDFSQEAALTNVGASLLVGGGVMGGVAAAVGLAPAVKRLGRNLLTEAEHGASARAARDLLDEAPSLKGGSSADEIAARGPDDAGVAYLRDNADSLTDDLATRQAKAAQTLIDTYGEMAPLRQTRQQVDELIPEAPVEQARWLTQARQQVQAELDGLPSDVAAATRERLSELGDGANPARWFTEASEASDELLRAAAKARRSGAEGAAEAADALGRAKAVLDEGLKDEGLWGGAARFEGQRAAGYAKRYGEHIDDFENAFSPSGKTDPDAFRRVLAGEADPAAMKALEGTLESARATADVAEQFGRKAEAGRIRGAIDELERASKQGQAVSAARASVSRGPRSASTRALDWLQNNMSPAAQEALGRVRARAGQGGAVNLRGAPRNGSIGQVAPDEFSIAGLSHDDMGADAFRPGVLEGLRKDEAFRSSGVPSMGKSSAKENLLLQLDTRGKPVFLNDGSHRLQVARERGLTHLPGIVQDADGAEVFRGRIRIADPEGGAVALNAPGAGGEFSLGDVAKSPAGVTTALGAGALGARELYQAQQDEARTGTYAAVLGLARSTKATLTRAVDKLLSRPAEGDAGLVVPAAAPRVTLENFDATRDHIDRMASDPEFFADVMAASFGSMPEAAPEIYSALSAEAAKTVQYLAAVAPGGSSGGPFGQRIPVGTDDLWEFNERLRALSDPDFVPEELAAGRLSSQAVEAYELMRPHQYAHLQRTVFERLGELNEAGVPVTVATREQLDVLLNIDGGGDPALTWKVAERAYAAQARKAASASARDAGGGGDPSDAMASGALATLNNGASAIAQTG